MTQRTFSVTLATPTDDEQLRRLLADPQVFDATARHLVATAPWLDGRAEPPAEDGPATPGLLLVAAAKDPALKPFADSVEVRIWRTPDEMRAGVSSGGMKAVVVPSYVAANLHNRGLGIRLANVLTHGLLQVVAPAGTVSTLADLKGKRVVVPFKNDMPDFVLRRLVAENGLKPGYSYRQSTGIRIADIFRGKHDQTTSDKDRIFPTLEHAREIINSRIGITSSNRLDESRYDIIMHLAIFIIG